MRERAELYGGQLHAGPRPDGGFAVTAMRAGACGFLLKHAPPEELLLGVRAAADGGALLSPAVTKRLLAEFTARRPAAVPAPGALWRLTSREREVFGLVVRGRCNAEIAAQLVVTPSTVKTHVGHILDKLGLRDRVHAVVFGYEHGLTGPGSDEPGAGAPGLPGPGPLASPADRPAAMRSVRPRPPRRPG